MKSFILNTILVIIVFMSQAQSDFKHIYKVENYIDVNTQYSELALIEFGENGQILVSDRGFRDKKRTWSGKAPFNLYSRENDGSFEIMSPKLNSEYNDGPLTTSKDGEIMFITTTNKTGKIDPRTKKMVYRLNISIAEFDNGKWSIAVVPELTDPRHSYAHPCLSPDGKTLYFVSDKPGGLGATDIYKCSVSGAEIVSAPENMDSSINTQYEEQFPFYHQDGYLFFSSRRKGGQGGLDIYYSKKLNYHEWTEAQPMAKGINSQAHESGIYLNKDMSAGYFTSNRMGGRGSDDIYLLHEINTPKVIASTTENIEENEIIATKEVVLASLDKNQSTELDVKEVSTEREIPKASQPVEKVETKIIKKEIPKAEVNEKIEKPTATIKKPIIETKKQNQPTIPQQKIVTKQEIIKVENEKEVEVKPTEEVSVKTKASKSVSKPVIKPENEILVKKVEVKVPVEKIEVEKKETQSISKVTEKAIKPAIKVEAESPNFADEVKTKEEVVKLVKKETQLITPTTKEKVNSELVVKEKASVELKNPVEGQNTASVKPIKKEVSREITLLENKIIDRKLNNVYFNSGSSDISSESKELIIKLSEILKTNPSAIIELHAHTDAKGNFSTNVQLSEKRARAVMNALNMKGISSNRMRYLAYGETDLIIKSKEDARLNRRVEFKIVDPKANNGNINPELHNSKRNNAVLDKGRFYVQIAAVNKSKTINYFNLKDFGVPICYMDKGMYKYVMGSYNSYAEAQIKRKEIEKNFPGVFIYLNVE